MTGKQTAKWRGNARFLQSVLKCFKSIFVGCLHVCFLWFSLRFFLNLCVMIKWFIGKGPELCLFCYSLVVVGEVWIVVCASSFSGSIAAL